MITKIGNDLFIFVLGLKTYWPLMKLMLERG